MPQVQATVVPIEEAGPSYPTTVELRDPSDGSVAVRYKRRGGARRRLIAPPSVYKGKQRRSIIRALISLLLTYQVLCRPSRTAVKETLSSLNRELDKNEIHDDYDLRFTNSSMENQTLQAGLPLELMCEVTGVPTPVVYWTLNGKRISGSYDNTIYEKLHNIGKVTIQNGVTTSKLYIPCVDKSHAGKYKCVGTNGHSRIEQSAKVTIAGDEKCLEAVKEAPKIVQWTASRFENEENAVQLICRTNVPASIAWYDESRRLLNDLPNFEVFPNGDLMIKKTSWDDMGDYTCVASNEHGEDRQTSFFYPTAKEAPVSK
ncbi:unnamed protein product [Caenorhabditis auriculariae]|uniref:Ig-like domain-containing protein n=1 Tax=Caenorhabditis auriculariae TaxID=2777116 RepID=A0A8S1H0A8_9PELO|nr:unnamed protein product [Caenorhabditis auriculariae]